MCAIWSFFWQKKEYRPTFVFRVFSVVVAVVRAVVSHANDDDLQDFFCLRTNECACIFAEAKRDVASDVVADILGLFFANFDVWAGSNSLYLLLPLQGSLVIVSTHEL